MKKIDLKLDFDAIRERIENDFRGLSPAEMARKIKVRANVAGNVHGKKKQNPSIEYVIAVSLYTGRTIEYYLWGKEKAAQLCGITGAKCLFFGDDLQPDNRVITAAKKLKEVFDSGNDGAINIAENALEAAAQSARILSGKNGELKLIKRKDHGPPE